MKTAAVLALTLLATPVAAQEALYPPPPPSPAEHFADLGKLQERVALGEPGTFAGLWVLPGQREIAVAFTRDAEATLRKYTKDPKYKAVNRPGPTARQLEDTREHLFNELQRLGARPVGAGVSIMDGRVEIEVTGDMTATRAAIASGVLVIPAWVTIQEPAELAFPEPPPPPPGMQIPVKTFPRVTYRSGGIELAVLITGEVVLEDGCLKLKAERRNITIAWPNEARLDLSHGDVRIFHRMSGVSIRPGETIILGGNSMALKDDKDVIGAGGECPGPYTYVSNFRPYAPFEAQMFERQIEEYAAEHKISRAEARRILDAQGERNRQLRTLGSDLQRAHPDVFGEMTVHGGKATLRLSGDLPVPLPPEFARDITIERVPRSRAALDAERGAILDQLEALALEGVSAGSDIERGMVTLNVGDNILKVADLIAAGRLTVPADVQIMTNGAGPAGHFSEWNMEAAWKALESSPGFPAVRALVAASDIPIYGEAPRKPSANGATDIARYLIMLGFTADEIRRLRAQGIDPVIDWEAQNGRSTLENRTALAEHVVIAEVVSVDPRTLLGDGARTTAAFRVTEALKGPAKPGDTVRVRLESGFNADGAFAQTNGDPMLLPGLPGALTPGDRYVLFLSSGQYANLARHAGGKPVAGMTMLRQEMTRVLPDGRLARSYGEPAPAPTLDELRRRVTAVAAKFRAAGVHQ